LGNVGKKYLVKNGEKLQEMSKNARFLSKNEQKFAPFEHFFQINILSI